MKPCQLWVYGFEPFGPYRRNITAELVRSLPHLPGLCTTVLPVRFEAELFTQPLQHLQPQWVLGLGQCPRGRLLRIERRAFNWMHDRQSGLNQVIEPQGPESVPASWRLKLSSRCRDSDDAGRYVCNFSMYVLNRQAQSQGFKSAFLHIPRHLPLGLARQEILRHVLRVMEA